MAYGITNFKRSLVAYTAEDGNVYANPMRTALIGAFAASPPAITAGTTYLSFPVGWRMAHVWAIASDGATPPNKLRKKFPVTTSVEAPTYGDTSASVDGVVWTAIGYVGEKQTKKI